MSVGTDPLGQTNRQRMRESASRLACLGHVKPRIESLASTLTPSDRSCTRVSLFSPRDGPASIPALHGEV